MSTSGPALPAAVHRTRPEGHARQLVLRTAEGVGAAGARFHVDGTAVTGFTSDPTLADPPAQSPPGAFSTKLRGTHTFTVEAAGDLAPDAPAPGDTSVIDATKLLDVEYRLG